MIGVTISVRLLVYQIVKISLPRLYVIFVNGIPPQLSTDLVPVVVIKLRITYTLTSTIMYHNAEFLPCYTSALQVFVLVHHSSHCFIFLEEDNHQQLLHVR